MPCAGPGYSCNSLINIRSPLGDVRLGAPDSSVPSQRSIWLLVRAYLAVREVFAHHRQRRALRRLDPRLLRDIGVSKAEIEREARRPFWVSTDGDGPSTICSATGEARLRAHDPPAQISMSNSRFLRACLAAAEWLAREQLRHAAREIDPRVLNDLAISDPETARELRILFGIGRDS